MVGVDIETIGFADLSQFKIKGYKLDTDIFYNTESVSYTKEDNEDDFITFTMTPEFDALGYESGEKGVTVDITEGCSLVETLHFPSTTNWNALQAFLDRKFA
jgi:hypothetical protein